MVSNFPRAHRSQRDKGPVCQDWLDLDLEHSLNTIDSMDTWTEPVDGKQKVWFLLLSALNTPNREITIETKPLSISLSHYIHAHKYEHGITWPKYLNPENICQSQGVGEVMSFVFLPHSKYLNSSSFPHFLERQGINMHAQNTRFLFSVTPVRSFPLCRLRKGVAEGKIGVIDQQTHHIWS